MNFKTVVRTATGEYEKNTALGSPNNQLGPPWGTMMPTASNCSIGGVSVGSFDRQWIEFRIPVTAGYDCDYNGPGCWTRIQFSFPTNVNDTTTWTAGLEGDPVRLVK